MKDESNAMQVALENAVLNAKIQRGGAIADPAISGSLRLLCEQHGYGNVMATVSTLWRERDPVGAFAFGPCIGTLDYFLRLARRAGVE